MTAGQSKLEWQRALTTLSGVAVFVVVVTALYWARSVLISVAMGVFFTFVLSPVVDWLERRRLGRVPAVLATVGLTVLAALLVGAVVVSQLSDFVNSLPGQRTQITAKLTGLRQQLGLGGENRFGQLIDDVGNVFSGAKEATGKVADAAAGVAGAAAGPGGAAPAKPAQTVVVENKTSSLFDQAQAVLGPVAEVAGQVGFGFLLSVFMLIKQEDLRNRLIRLTGGARHLTTTTKAVGDASGRISRFLFMQLIINSAFGAAVTLALLLAGVKLALLWGFLGFLMRYVPYVGTFIGLVPPVLVSFATSEGETWWAQPLTVVAVFVTFEVIANNVFEPWLFGASMGLSEVAQLTAAAFWAFLWGPVGLVLSGPLTVCLLVLGKYSPRFKFFEVLLGDEPALSPDVRVYQRLAARDQDEAEEVARDELKKGTAEDVFDRVLVPALSYAKRDHQEATLSDDDYRAVLQSMKEITDELADTRVVQGDPPPPHEGRPVRVLAVPARDAADEVPLAMLKGLLDPTRWEVALSPAERLTSEVVAAAGETNFAVIVVGALPPGGLAHTRYLCKRIRRQYPDARLVVGRWGLAEAEAEENRRQLADAGAGHVATSLADTARHLGGWLAVLSAQQAAAAGAGKTPALAAVGTSSA